MPIPTTEAVRSTESIDSQQVLPASIYSRNEFVFSLGDGEHFELCADRAFSTCV